MGGFETLANGPNAGCVKFGYDGDWEFAIAAYVPALILSVAVGIMSIQSQGYELPGLLLSTGILMAGEEISRQTAMLPHP